MQLIGIALLLLVGPSGSEGIIGKKCAEWSIRRTTFFQINWLDQKGRCRLEITSLNLHSAKIDSGTRFGFLSTQQYSGVTDSAILSKMNTRTLCD